MLTLNVNCKSRDEKDDLCYRICESLQGSPAFISNEIVVSDDDHTGVTILIGNQNHRDVVCDLDSENFHENKEQETVKEEPINILDRFGMSNVIDNPRIHIGLYLLLKCGANGPVLIACDNSTGEAWTEEFHEIKAAVNWLRRK